ncbi:BPI fold-containing family B member 4-like [Heliangelus exortis]|uniref:BPI fold-containing family B member 4-like n=1 Tax=Heliangelus exortis TaxID=472823 RepID=UPI003A933354
MLGPEMLLFWILILQGGFLLPSQGLPILNSIPGLSPPQSQKGLLGGLLGGAELLGNGLLGRGSTGGQQSGGERSRSGILGTGLPGQTSISGLLGTDTPILGNGGLLSNDLLSNNNLLGGKGLLGTGVSSVQSLGNGLLSNGLLNNDLLGNNNLLGDNGLLGTGNLLGNGSLLGLGGLVDGGVLGKSPFAWLKVLNIENLQMSWKILHGGELVLNLYSKLVLQFPGVFQFLSGSSIETNLTSHIRLTQDTPGDLRLEVKDCKKLLGNFNVNMRKGLLTNLVSGILNSSLQTLVPALLCPVVNIWVSAINLKLQFLNVVSFGLLGKLQSALSKLPVASGHFVELDLQNSPFPSVFIDWLLQTTGLDPGTVP